MLLRTKWAKIECGRESEKQLQWGSKQEWEEWMPAGRSINEWVSLFNVPSSAELYLAPDCHGLEGVGCGGNMMWTERRFTEMPANPSPPIPAVSQTLIHMDNVTGEGLYLPDSIFCWSTDTNLIIYLLELKWIPPPTIFLVVHSIFKPHLKILNITHYYSNINFIPTNCWHVNCWKYFFPGSSPNSFEV